MSNQNTNIFHKVSWKLAVPLALLGLLWPLSKAIDLTDEWAPGVIGGVWVGIRVVWVIITVLAHDKQPFWTVMGASVLYEAIAIIPQQINWDEAAFARVPAMIATLIMGVVVGAIFGAIAQAITRRPLRGK